MQRFATALLMTALAISHLAHHATQAAEPPNRAHEPAQAREIDDRKRAASLDERFAALKAARSEADAEPIVAEIWSLWMQSGDPALDEMMRQAAAALGVGAVVRAGGLLDEILKRKPDWAEAWNKRATLRFVERRFDEALADCVETLNREPRHFGALAGMGLIAIEQENWKGALAAYRRALTLNPFIGERAWIPALEKKVEGRPL